jgi:NADH-quinone oxidoreductase subunit M
MRNAFMLHSWMLPWFLVAVPCIGAAFSLLWWSSLHRMKMWSVLAAVACLLTTISLSWDLNDPYTSLPLLLLLPLAACVSLLGQPLHQDNRPAWLMTPVLLGLGLGILTAHDFAGDILVVVLLGLLCVLLYRYRSAAGADIWRAEATYGFGMVAALLSLVLPISTSALAMAAVCATLLPLLPLHGGFIVALTKLPGNLPAFVALLLPLVGFHRFLSLLPHLADPVFQTLAVLALMGAGYGSLRAFVQSQVPPRLAYGGMALVDVLLWYVADTRTAPVHATVYLTAVGLALSGLLLAWYSIRARYGDIDLKAMGGMVYPMPRFSTLLCLLALAAVGMPPFGVFTGFMGMLLSPAFIPSAAFAVIMLVWLSASWYLIDVVQQTVFGRQRPDLRYEDLRRPESAALLLIVLLLLALGIAPSRFFQPGPAPLPDAVARQAVTWLH